MLEKWEADVVVLDDGQWEQALHSINLSSVKASQRLSQLCILLHVHHTPIKLYKLGLVPDPICCKCQRPQKF